MLTGLALKELRELSWLAVAALVANLLFVISVTGFGLAEDSDWSNARQLPFNLEMTLTFTVIGASLAAGLGLGQTVSESARGTYQFLLNRPASRRGLLGTKLLVGGGLYLAISVLPLLLYAWWAATPGTHASPFRWSMTALAWKGWLAGTILYLGAFLAGIRPVRWYGTRLLPLVAAVVLAFPLTFAPLWWSVGVLLVVLLDVLLLANIFYVARTRDFS